VTAERKRAADIHAACQMVGKADKAVAFIADGKSLSEVVAALQADRRAANPPDVNARHSASDTSRELPKPDLNASEIYSTRAKARSQRAAV
jgi:hypothetical protein